MSMNSHPRHGIFHASGLGIAAGHRRKDAKSIILEINYLGVARLASATLGAGYPNSRQQLESRQIRRDQASDVGLQASGRALNIPSPEGEGFPPSQSETINQDVFAKWPMPEV